MEKLTEYQIRKIAENGEDISNLDVSHITYMGGLFIHLEDFNQDISRWDVSNVHNMIGMFENCRNFNQDLSSWNVSNVTKFI